MHILIQERCMVLPKHAAGSGMGDRACKTSFLGFWCTKEPPPSIQTDVGLVGAEMESYLIILYVIVPTCVHG